MGWAQIHRALCIRIGAISRISSQMKALHYGHGITLGELLLKHADITVQHKPLSATERQRVPLMNVGTLTEIRGDSINSGHRWPEKRKLSTWLGTSKKKMSMRFDDGLCKWDITETEMTSIIRHSLMSMIGLPFESNICQPNCFVPWSGHWLMPVRMRIMRGSGPGLIWTLCISS